MKTIFFTTILTVFALYSHAQSFITGQVLDENAKPLPYATVALLNPNDSTLAFFGITNDKGAYEIKKIKHGKYLLQAAFVGHKTLYRSLNIPSEEGDYGIIVLETNPINLTEAEIKSEYVPLRISNDTVEYNSGAFKVKSGAVAEDLLKKLPGVEVDQSGNIKVMGEDVRKVMVEGKEFFSSDPKVATKNLPADAIKKVQVYDKKSESSELAGIEDDSREKTINLLLKDGKKEVWLGELQAGIGTESHYTSTAKAYRFTTKNQFAVLGMLNNVNRFGFSFQDYMDFNGGMQSMGGGGRSVRVTISDDSNLPINYGQSINGMVTSGAGGINYSFEPRKNNRFNFSYLGNGSKRDLSESISTLNYLPNKKYLEEELNDEYSKNYSHRLNFGWKDKSDSTRTLLLNGNIGIVDAKEDAHTIAEAYVSGDLINILNATSKFNSDNINANGSFSGMFKGHGAFKLYTFNGYSNFSSSISKNQRININRLIGEETRTDNQFRDTDNTRGNYGFSSSTLILISKGLYLEPQVRGSISNDNLDRQQGFPGDAQVINDSLSPNFDRSSFRITPGLSLRYNIGKSKLVIGLSSVHGSTSNNLNDTSKYVQSYNRLLPSFNWERSPKAGQRLMMNYSADVNEPAISLLLPVIENSNPRSLFIGNRKLKPETLHQLSLHWLLFDQFSRTSIFTMLNGTYTQDKIGYAREVSDSLVQKTTMLNIGDAYSSSGRVEFSTPLRFIGFTMRLSASGTYNEGMNMVNRIQNKTTSLSRTVRLNFTNLKMEKWNIDFGGELTFTNASYSLQESMNNKYSNYNYFAKIQFNPTQYWHFEVNADVVNYGSKSFTSAVTIPLVSAELSYSFLKSKKASIIIEAFDLLDKNTGISRISEMNYLREVKSNVVGRYGLLSFKYKI